MMTGKIIFGIFVGLAGGFATGAGFVAFLTVLGVIPRLTQLTKTMKMIHYLRRGHHCRRCRRNMVRITGNGTCPPETFVNSDRLG